MKQLETTGAQEVAGIQAHKIRLTGGCYVFVTNQ